MKIDSPSSREEIRSYISSFTAFPDEEGPKPGDYGISDPRLKYGLSDDDINYFKYRDVELKQAIDKYMRMDFPVHTIDDFMIVELAGMLQKLGEEAAITMFKATVPRRLQALYRAVGRNHKAKERKI